MPARPLWTLIPLALLSVLCLVHRSVWPGLQVDWSLKLEACADVRPTGAPCHPGRLPAPSAVPPRARSGSAPAPARRGDPACQRVLSGEAFSFGPGWQDWYIYNSFFGGRGRGAGAVLALGPAGPSTLFFVRCLGWALVAVPRPPEDGSVGQAILDAARSAGVARFELAVLNFSEAGSELLLSECLHLSSLAADLWLVAGNRHGQRPMDLLFHASGYGGVMTFLDPASGEEGSYASSLYRRVSASLPRLPPPETEQCSASARYHRKQWCQTYQTVWRGYKTPWACPADPASWAPAPSPEEAEHAARVDRLLRRVEPAYAAPCEAMLSGRAATFSQGWQDWFVYHNFFREREWGDGVYMDIGTNDPEVISNTLFFDKCLGWRGVCAEMNPRYHKGIRERRSCSLVPTCVLGAAGTVRVANGLGETSRIVGGRGRKLVPTLNCTTFSDIFRSHGFDHVDFVSIDVEGTEPNILRCLDFSAVNVSMWLVEGDKQDAHAMDRFFQRRNYSTVMTFLNAVDHRANFYIDTLYSSHFGSGVARARLAAGSPHSEPAIPLRPATDRHTATPTMQTTRAASALVLALLAVGASAARRSSSSAGLSQAREWLRSHGPAPPQDELQELKGANPEAYAIVKALLTKRALGLLDPRHPTASFAPGRTAEAAPPVSSVDFAASVGVRASSGAAASESSDDAAVEVAPPPAHHSHRDWLSWRPADSAAEDDAQVQQVLGTASQLRAGGVASSAAGVGDAPAPPAAQPAAAQPSAAQPAAATEQTSSYPKGVDLGAPALPDAAAAPKAQGNSYLEGLDLGSPGRAAPEPAPAARQQGLVGVRQAVSQDSGGGDYLRGFSWSDGGGDAAASRPDVDAHPLPPARIVSQDAALPAARVLTSFGGQPEAAASAPAQTTPAPPRKQNALVSWLGSSWGPVQAPPTAERAAASSSGPSAHRGAGRYSQYLRDLTGSS